MRAFKTHLNKGGRIVIPASYRQALNLQPGDDVLLILEDNEVRLIPHVQAVRRAQALVRRFVSKDRALSNELIKERHEETILEGRRARSWKQS